MDIAEWIGIGVANKWCTEVTCQTHDGVKLTDEEEQEFETGDPCIPVVRIWTEGEMDHAG
jgi:hypothetical protein